MPEYDVQRWDAVIPKDNDLPYPMIYIKSDADFVKYAEENNYMITLTVSGTNKYDQKSVIGIIQNSAYFPDYRPNFYNDTGFYTITLLTNWLGYPETNGKVLLRGLEGADAIKVEAPAPYVPPKPLPWNWNVEGYTQDKESNLSSNQVGFILIGILVIFGGLLFVSKSKSALKK